MDGNPATRYPRPPFKKQKGPRPVPRPAIAYAREGPNVAINYFPTEEPDAREVIALIHETECKCALIAGDLREENSCKQLVARAVENSPASTLSEFAIS